jgi:hypothetical protein
MSATNFFRLYREIDKSLPSNIPPDLNYQKERLEVFHKLKGNSYLNNTVMNGITAEPGLVAPPKHHGKFIRMKARNGVTEERRKKVEQSDIDRKRDLEIRRYIQETQETTQLISEIDNRVSSKKSKTLPSRLLKKLTLVEDKRVGDTAMLRENAFIGSNIPSPGKVKENPIYTPHIAQKGLVFDRNYSEAKWSLEERQKLYSLYQQFELPPVYCKNVEIWKLYFLKVADSFRILFPKRTTEEVVQKVREMVAKRQMKEAGEDIFWNSVVRQCVS